MGSYLFIKKYFLSGLRMSGNNLERDGFEDRQYRVAMTFILGFFALLGISIIYYFITRSLDIAEFVGTLFGGWVGTIIGFYFRERQVEQLSQSLKEERNRTEALTNYIRQKSDEIWRKLEGKT